MKYKVNKEKCMGCGLCVNLCPDVFELGEDGKSQIKEGADLEKNKKCVEEVIQSCPMRAVEEEK
jgi:ferredoxin